MSEAFGGNCDILGLSSLGTLKEDFFFLTRYKNESLGKNVAVTHQTKGSIG